MTPTPVFLLGPARSGTTLLQRMIGDHLDVATHAEPWALLSLLGWTLDDRVGPYGGAAQYRAMREFVDQLPGGQAEYLTWAGESARALYARVAPDARYFLDKTPRYDTICLLLPAMFPEAKFVLLWRNPLAALASSLETWNGGRWNPHKFEGSTVPALRRLARFAREHEDRLVVVHYEQLVVDPQRAWERVAAHLDLDPTGVDVARAASQPLAGAFGDPTGQYRYSEVVAARADGWTSTWSTPVRRRWAGTYLDRVGEDVLTTMGYDRADLLAELGRNRGRPAWLTVRDLGSGFLGWRRQIRRLRRQGGMTRDEAVRQLRGDSSVEVTSALDPPN